MNAALEKRLKRQVIGKLHRFQAVVPLGFEQTFVNELECIRRETRDDNQARRESQPTELGITESKALEQPQIVGDGKVEFTAKITDAWKAVAYSRIANRVLMHIADFKAENFRELEKKASEIPFELYLTTNHQPLITIHVTCKHSRLYHSDAIAERLYNVISQSNITQSEASSEGEARPHTPWFDKRLVSLSNHTNRFIAVASDPTPQNLYVTLIDDRCTIWLDLAGEELYKRGFERFVNDAPLKETIAAAMIFEAINCVDPIGTPCLQDDRHQDDRNGVATLTTNHQPQTTLLDLMAGSGTFSLEAACIANNIIPGACRDFALMHQPAFKEATWRFLIRRENGTSAAISKIITSDISPKAISIIKHNVECSPLASITPKPINPQLRDFFSYTAKEIAEACGDTSPILVLNPPYGKRLDFDAPKLYTKIGKKLADIARELKAFNKALTVAILAPKDDTREGSKYTCTTNLLRESPALAPNKNSTAKLIETSHGGFSLNAFIAKI